MIGVELRPIARGHFSPSHHAEDAPRHPLLTIPPRASSAFSFHHQPRLFDPHRFSPLDLSFALQCRILWA